MPGPELMLIGFTGYSRAGKDTAALALADTHKRLAFADAVRDFTYAFNAEVKMVVDALGWETAKGAYPFTVEELVRVGEAGRAAFGPDFWITRVVEQMAASPERNFVITDVRHRNEAQRIRNLGGVVYRITRPGTTPRGIDRNLDLYDFPVIRNNCDIESFQQKVRERVRVDAERRLSAC
jgi:hypothetical protein